MRAASQDARADIAANFGPFITLLGPRSIAAGSGTWPRTAGHLNEGSVSEDPGQVGSTPSYGVIVLVRLVAAISG